MSTHRIVLVDLVLRHAHDPLVNLGAAGLLAALLQVMPASALLMPIAVNQSGITGGRIARRILRKVEREDPSAIVGLGAYVWNDGLIRETITSLRQERFRGRIVVGGPQITFGTTSELDYAGANVFIRGYAEQALPAVVHAEARGLRGVQYANAPAVTEPCDFDLAACPSPYLSGTLRVTSGQEVVRWETQRGCPYRCAYCQHRDPGMRANVQIVPFDRLSAELDLFTSRGVREIKVIDPVFNRGEHSLRILEAMNARRFRGRVSVQCRPELLSMSFVKASGGLDVVPELGLQTIHPNEGRLVNRIQNLDQVSKAFELLNDRGFRYSVTIIYGLPGQTLASFMQTIDFCLEHRVPVLRAFPLMLLKGCGLDRRREELGLVLGDGVLPIVQSSPTFDKSDFQIMAALAKKLDLTAGSHPRSISDLMTWKRSYRNAGFRPRCTRSFLPRCAEANP